MTRRVRPSDGSAQLANSGPNPRELLDEGLRFEKAGMLDRALDRYQLALQRTDDAAIISESLRRQAHVFRQRCEWDRALAAAARSAATAAAAGAAELVAEAWNAEAAVHQSRGDYDTALVLYERMLECAGPGRVRGVALQNLGTIHASRGEFAEAERLLRAAHADFEAAQYQWGMGHVLNNLGRLALDRGAADAAETELAEAIQLAHELGDLELLSLARLNHAEALLLRGELDRAEEDASASLGHFSASRNDWRRVECLRLLGDIRRRQARTEEARRHYEAARAIAAAIGAKPEHELLARRLAALDD